MRRLTMVFTFLGLCLLPALAPAELIATASGLRYEEPVVGTGPEAVSGALVEVHYTGWLSQDGARGRKFDSSLDRQRPFDFKLGAGLVIKGWEEGVAGMRAGGRRVLHIPARLGYGARGAGSVIPGNADLIFEVELLRVNGVAGEAGKARDAKDDKDDNWGRF